MKKVAFAFAAVVTGLWSCSQEKAPSQLKERWDARNSPNIMDTGDVGRQGNYIYALNRLPLNASLEETPWSGDYFPTFKGGITYRWNDYSVTSEIKRYSYELKDMSTLTAEDIQKMSPAEKFDVYLGLKDYPYTNWERKRTQVLKTVKGNKDFQPGFEIPKWEGLCHAWAPATLAFKEPKPVTVKGLTGVDVPFGSADIKALLTYFLHEVNAPTRFLGNRCNDDMVKLTRDYREGRITKAYYLEQKQACSDTNAGSFHLVIANEIGLRKEGFVADVTRSSEVWNQAVSGYSSKILHVRNGASEGAAPGTVQEATVRTRMDYIVENGNHWNANPDDKEAYAIYDYRLELNQKGEIIGGAWLTEDSDRPDFLWKQKTPKFEGVYKYLGYIYYQSIGQQGTDSTSTTSIPSASGMNDETTPQS